MRSDMNLRWLAAVLAIVLSCVVTSPSRGAEGDAYKLAEMPERFDEVIPTRVDAKDQQEVVVVGRIGGRTNPWVKGTAAFSIVDRSKRACNEIPGDTCKTPWDYCCETDLPKATVLVMFVDGDGKVVKQDAKELLGVKELDTVYVAGKAKRDKAGNITVMASKLYVPQEESDATQ